MNTSNHTKSLPLVSVCMMLFNESRFVRSALDSLLKQDYPNWELIVSDNCSTDDTWAIVREYANRDGRIRSVRQPYNIGVKSGEVAINMAKGDYLMIAAGHDYWEPSFISSCVAELIADPSVIMAYPKALWIDVNGNPLQMIPTNLDTRGMTSAAARLNVVLWGLGYSYQMYGLFRRSFFDGWKAKPMLAPDNLLLANAAIRGTFAQVPQVLFHMRRMDDYGSWESYVSKIFCKSLASGDLKSEIIYFEMVEEFVSLVNTHFPPGFERDSILSSVVLCLFSKYQGILRGVSAVAGNTGLAMTLQDITRFAGRAATEALLLVNKHAENQNGMSLLDDELDRQEGGASATSATEDVNSSSSIMVSAGSASSPNKIGSGTSRHIVIDGVIFQLQAGRPLGISRVWRNLIPELIAGLPGHSITVLKRKGFPTGLQGATEHEIPAYRPGPAPVLDADDAMLAQVCAELGADVFVSTYYTRAPGIRNVLMMYDMIPEIMGFDLSQPEWCSKQRAIVQADSYIAISQSTQNDLLRLHQIASDRVTVAHCGVSSVFHPAEQEAIERFIESHGIRFPYFILSGNRGLYKDCTPFFRALASMPERDYLQVFAFGGEQYLLPEEARYAQDCYFSAAAWLPDSELSAAYSGALALVYPSRYEGFGLPVLEAMACGCPVISARNSSLPEVGGDAVLYVDPVSSDEIANAMREVLQPDVRVRLATSGVDRARHFSWPSMARTIAEVLVGEKPSPIPVSPSAIKDAPLVSAIVSVYNAERFIRGCLDDLEQQTIADKLEIVIINSCSPQGEDAIIREYMQRYDNIVYIKTDQREPIYRAWNRGVEAAHGKFVTNANTDDRHRRDAFELLARTLDEHPDVTVVYANSLITYTENETFETASPIGIFQWQDFDRRALFARCFIGPQPMWRREVHDEYGGFDESFESAGDYEFWLRISMTRQFLHVKETLGLYLSSPTGIERGDMQRSIREAMQARARHYASLAAGSPAASPPWPEDVIAQVRLADEQFGHGNLAAARDAMSQALAILPDDPQLILTYGNVVLRLGDVEGARREFVKAATLHPNHGPAHLNLAAVLVMLERREEAEHSVKRALELNPNDSDAIKLFGRLCVENGRYEAGAKAYAVALDSNPSDIEALLMLGRCACETGDLETARLMYERVLQIEPGNAGAAECLVAVKGQATAAGSYSAKISKIKTPMVSVIVPTHNRPDTLLDALRSILNQTYRDFEIIVVNDGGSDIENIVRFLDKDGRITYIRHGSNRDRAAARNTGIMVASGKYIAYLDDDDLYYPDHLHTLVTFMQQSGQKVAYSDAHRAHQEKRDGRYIVTKRDMPYSFDFDHDRILVHNFIPVLCLMHEKECLDIVGLFDESLTTHEDWDLLIRLSRRFQFAHIKKVTCEFASRTDGSTTTSSKLPDFRRTYAIILERYKASAIEKPHIRAAQERLLQSMREKTASTDVATQPAWPAEVIEQVREAEQHLVQGDPSAAAQALNQALQTVPHDPELIVAHGNVLLRLGDVEAARREFVKATVLSPEYAPAHSNLAAVLLHLDRAEDAEASARQALALNPADTDALKVLARVCLDGERFAEAVQAYVAVLRLHPDDVETLLVVGNCYAEAGRPEDATTFYQRVLQLDPGNTVAAENLVAISGNRDASDSAPLRADRPSEDPRALSGARSISHEPIASIVIVTYNSASTIRACLESVFSSTRSPIELIVVDNASTDATRAVLAEYQGRITTLFNAENAGFSRGCNQGIRASAGQHVVLLNPDTVITSGWLERMKAHFGQDVGAVGPVSDFAAGLQNIDRHLPEGAPSRMGLLEVADLLARVNHGKGLEVRLLTGFCVMIPRKVLDEIGLLDETLFLGNDDLDLSWRLREQGYRLVVATDTFVHHKGQASFTSAPSEQTSKLVQESTDRLYAKLEAHYGNGSVPPPMELWGIDWFRPSHAHFRPQASSPVQGLTSIIILAFNGLEHTIDCLKSINAYTQETHEIIVVDNGSTDGTVDYLRRYSVKHENIRVIANSSNKGFAAGNNQGLSIARGEYLLLLNNDTMVTSGWLKGMLKLFKQHQDVGIAGPMSNHALEPQLVPDAKYQSIPQMEAFAAKWSADHAGQSLSIKRVVGFCLMTTRRVIDLIGGLDERFGSGNFEDDDLCCRAALAGFQARIAQDVYIHHTGGQTFKIAGIDYSQSLNRNWELFKAKWGIPADAPYEKGYCFPSQIPQGSDLSIPLPNVGADHRCDDQGRWWQEISERPDRSQPAVTEEMPLSVVIVPNGHGLAPLWPSLVQYTKHPLAITILPSHGNGNGDDPAHEATCPDGWRISTSDLSAVRLLNQLMQSADDDPVILLSSDLILTPGWLKRLLAAFNRDRHIAVVGPTLNQGPATQRIKAEYKGTGKALRQFGLRRAHRYGGELAEVDSLAPFCIVFKGSACRPIGLLREDLDLAASLHDYFARLRQAGRKVAVILDTYAHHEPHADLPSIGARRADADP